MKEKNPKKQRQPFVIPQKLLNQINEVSNRGWILFTFDDANQFRIYSQYDDELAAVALRNNISNYAEAMKNLEMQSTINGILNNMISFNKQNPPEEDTDSSIE